MDFLLRVRHVSPTFRCFKRCINELFALFIFLIILTPIFQPQILTPIFQPQNLSLWIKMMFAVRKRTTLNSIQNLFEDLFDIHAYNTRSSAALNFYVKPVLLNYRFKLIAFLKQELKCIWNEMPLAIRNLSKRFLKIND